MTKVERFVAYALAFERAFETDEWSEVGEFFTEDAEYDIVGLGPPIGGSFRGREQILTYFKDILDQVDRRFETREGSTHEGFPRERDGNVWLRGRVTYRSPGVPEIAVEVEETAIYRGERICRLVDTYTPATREQLEAYQDGYGQILGIKIS